jgi:hypothetical protein
VASTQGTSVSSNYDCVDNDDDCGESDLDLQYLLGLSPDTPLTYWNSPSTSSFADWISS